MSDNINSRPRELYPPEPARLPLRPPNPESPSLPTVCLVQPVPSMTTTATTNNDVAIGPEMVSFQLTEVNGDDTTQRRQPGWASLPNCLAWLVFGRLGKRGLGAARLVCTEWSSVGSRSVRDVPWELRQSAVRTAGSGRGWQAFPNLRELTLEVEADARRCSSGLRDMSSLQLLQRLRLKAPGCNAEEWPLSTEIARSLAGLLTLQKLTLENFSLVEESIGELLGLKSLSSLRLKGCRLDRASLVMLRYLKTAELEMESCTILSALNRNQQDVKAAWDALGALTQITALRTVDPIDGTCLSALQGLPQLENLSVVCGSLMNPMANLGTTLKALPRSLASLELLAECFTTEPYIFGPLYEVTDSVLSAVASHTQLKNLVLPGYGPSVTVNGKGPVAMNQLTHLKSLHVDCSGTNTPAGALAECRAGNLWFTDGVLAKMTASGSLADLSSVTLTACMDEKAICDFLAALKTLPNLKELCLPGCHALTNAALSELQKLTSIEVLHICTFGRASSEAFQASIMALPRLKHLRYQVAEEFDQFRKPSGITMAGIEAIHPLRPAVHIARMR